MVDKNTKSTTPSKELTLFADKNHISLGHEDGRGAAIHIAVWEGNLAIVKELLALYRQSCVNAKDKLGKKRGRTPLHNAAQLGHNSIVIALLDNGADIDARTVYKYTALSLATQNNRVETVKTLLQRNADLNAAVNSNNREYGDGMTAVHLAARLQSPTILLQLLWHGARTDITTVNGDTALHFAADAASASCYFFLHVHGTPGPANKEGLSPSDIISKLKKQDKKAFDGIAVWLALGDKDQFLACVRRYTTGNPDLPRAFHNAVEKDRIGAVVYLLQIDPELVHVKHPNPKEGHLPLHAAARIGHSRVVDVLLRHGAKVDARAPRDWTALMLACRGGRVNVASMLCKAGADATLKNSSGESAILLATKANISVPELPPLFRYVPSKKVPSPKPTNEQDGSKLSTPDKAPRSRTPSPSWPADTDDRAQGELFAMSDAQEVGESSPEGKNPKHIEKFLTDLERTWYNRIQWSPEDDSQRNRYPERSGPVKIAILDSGIDLQHDDFQRPAKRRSKVGIETAKQLPEEPQRTRIKAYRNFIGRPGEEDDVTDSVGHGTHLAGIIMAIAPRAHLYIAKTSTKSDQRTAKKDENLEDGVRRKVRRPIEEALKWAIEQNVDIINLSLGFPQESSYELTKALREAHHRGIIVFAAAANHGNRDAIAWPARDPDLAICITSGDEFNNLSRFAPSGNTNLPVFITHGEDVWSQWPTNLGGGFRPMSGTSVSTPIAAGMAAMILAFLNTTSLWSPSEKRQWLSLSKEDHLRSTRGMRQLLEHMCRERAGFRVLSPKLMWEVNPDATSIQALNTVAQPFHQKG